MGQLRLGRPKPTGHFIEILFRGKRQELNAHVISLSRLLVPRRENIP